VVSSESPARALQSWLSHKRRRRKRTRRGVGSRSKLIEEEEEEKGGGEEGVEEERQMDLLGPLRVPGKKVLTCRMHLQQMVCV
jgi:hypothetical protein